MSDLKSTNTPLELNVKIWKEEWNRLLDFSLYRWFVGSLLSFSLTRSDICHTVQVVSQVIPINHISQEFIGFLDIFMACSILGSSITHHLHYISGLMRIGHDVLTLEDQPLGGACFSVHCLYLVSTKGKQQSSSLLLKLNTDPCLLQLVKWFGLDFSFVNLKFYSSVPRHAMLTRVLFRLLQI